MGVENERMKILDLLEKGSISRSEAENLLTALSAASDKPAIETTRDEAPKKAHWIQIRITQLSSGKRKLTLVVPLFLIRLGIAFSKRHADSDEDRAALLLGRDFFRNPIKGNIVDTSDPEDDERVEITFL